MLPILNVFSCNGSFDVSGRVLRVNSSLGFDTIDLGGANVVKERFWRGTISRFCPSV